jgi:hypothetical protein
LCFGQKVCKEPCVAVEHELIMCVRGRNSTVGDVFRKIMGDVPLAYVETVGGQRVSEDDLVAVGKNDILSFKVGRG